MLNYEKKINRALEEYTFLNYFHGVSTAFSFESDSSLTTIFYIRKKISEHENGVKGGFYDLRVTVGCEFKEQNKKSSHVSAMVESNCVFSLVCGEEKEEYGVSGTLTSLVIFFFKFISEIFLF